MNKQMVKVVEISPNTLKLHTSYNQDTYKKLDGSVYVNLLFPMEPRHSVNCCLFGCIDNPRLCFCSGIHAYIFESIT